MSREDTLRHPTERVIAPPLHRPVENLTPMAEVASPLARTVEALRGPARLVGYLTMATSVVAGGQLIAYAILGPSRGGDDKIANCEFRYGYRRSSRTRPSFCGVVPCKTACDAAKPIRGRGSMAKLRYLLPLVLVTGLLALPTGASANPNISSVSFAGNATLLFSPGPVNVTLHYSCPPPNPGAIAANVVQNDVVVGTAASEPANCDGQNHSVTLTIEGLFVPGTAQGVAAVDNANPSGSGFAFANQQIMIRK